MARRTGTADLLREAVSRARIGRTDQLHALERLVRWQAEGPSGS